MSCHYSINKIIKITVPHKLLKIQIDTSDFKVWKPRFAKNIYILKKKSPSEGSDEAMKNCSFFQRSNT